MGAVSSVHPRSRCYKNVIHKLRTNPACPRGCYENTAPVDFRLSTFHPAFRLTAKYMWIISTGPGLAIRVICAEEPYMEKDFAETSNMLKTIVDFSNAVKKVDFVLYVVTGCSV